MSIDVSLFALRQTRESKFSHYDGTWDELCDLVAANFHNARLGYREGVLTVPVPATKFFTGVVEVTPGTSLVAVCEARRPEEAPFIQVTAPLGKKIPATTVEIVLYHSELIEADQRSPYAEWEIVSINASTSVGPEPMTPMAMARNFLGLQGGTTATYTAQEFAHAIIYWSTRAMRG